MSANASFRATGLNLTAVGQDCFRNLCFKQALISAAIEGINAPPWIFNRNAAFKQEMKETSEDKQQSRA